VHGGRAWQLDSACAWSLARASSNGRALRCGGRARRAPGARRQMHACGARMRAHGLDEKWLLKCAKVEIRNKARAPWIYTLGALGRVPCTADIMSEASASRLPVFNVRCERPLPPTERARVRVAVPPALPRHVRAHRRRQQRRASMTSSGCVLVKARARARQVVRAGEGERLSAAEMRGIAAAALARLRVKLEPGAPHGAPRTPVHSRLHRSAVFARCDAPVPERNCAHNCRVTQAVGRSPLGSACAPCCQACRASRPPPGAAYGVDV
jgi:hypothetical protein